MPQSVVHPEELSGFPLIILERLAENYECVQVWRSDEGDLVFTPATHCRTCGGDGCAETEDSEYNVEPVGVCPGCNGLGANPSPALRVEVSA